ncbi:uncharacterized protein LOC118464587 [Anopheles albimanus]|uniref:uncharacterized protein LOC118464587 n=1 Tax=Anopheles albimanus TaxID=7167 RepID=UPI0016417E9E|nr:uncharacterized protein LOC118464587 [Anopheles albimanus]
MTPVARYRAALKFFDPGEPPRILPRRRGMVVRQATGAPASFNEKLLAALNLPGLQYVFDRQLHLLERFRDLTLRVTWTVVILAAIGGTIQFGRIQYARYTSNPTVIQMDKNYRDWVGIMPGLTYCFHDRIDWHRARQFLERHQLLTPRVIGGRPAGNESTGNTPLSPYLTEFVQTLVEVTATSFGNLSRFINDTPLVTGVDVLELISWVHPQHDIAINSFEPEHANLPVQQIVTENGICYALNVAPAYLQSSNYTRDNLQTSNKDALAKKPPITCEFSRYHCYMKLDTYRSTMSYTVHSPYEVATNDQLYTAVDESDELVAIYTLLETVSTERLKELSVEQRKCYFYDESYNQLPFYSRNLCLMSCRAARAVALCRCRPHFYPFAEGPQCSVLGLYCLQQNPEWHNNVDCRCRKTCNDVGYFVTSQSKTQWTAEGGIPFTHKASLRWEILQPKTRLRRVVIFSYEDLLVSLGGAVALFIGKNALAISKIVDFIAIELYAWASRAVDALRSKRKVNVSVGAKQKY